MPGEAIRGCLARISIHETSNLPLPGRRVSWCSFVHVVLFYSHHQKSAGCILLIRPEKVFQLNKTSNDSCTDLTGINVISGGTSPFGRLFLGKIHLLNPSEEASRILN
jgi:hypothetical protein